VSAGRDRWLRGALLVGLVVLAYLPALQAGFIWDDDKHLTENPCIVGPLGFAGIWTTAEATYYPLVLSTFWVEHALWGLAPMPYHLVNVLVHAACAIALWLVLARLLVPGAWLGAALWALHPVQVESVAWVTELKNTQSALFFLLAVLFFLKWLESPEAADGGTGRPFYAAALLCAAAAILSKSSTVMLPVVLALCVWWKGERWRWRMLTPLAPFFFIAVAASAWTIWEQQFHSGALGAEWALTLAQRVIIAGRDPWFYLGKLLWPHPLVFIYPRWTIDASSPSAYLPAIAGLTGMAVLWGRRDRWGRPAFFAFAYFVVSLFPVLAFFKVYYFRFSFVADHFQYLASMGPLALAGAAICRLPALAARFRPASAR
jgi:hypothetical protein